MSQKDPLLKSNCPGKIFSQTLPQRCTNPLFTVAQGARKLLKLSEKHSSTILLVLMLQHERSKSKWVSEAFAKVPKRQAICDKARVPARRAREGIV